MREVIYVMQFTGRVEAVAGSADMLKAAATATSCTIASMIGPDGVQASIEAAIGEHAAFESEVVFTSEREFSESGAIAFGRGHLLQFTNIGLGTMIAHQDGGIKQGAVAWRVEGGTGQFEGAQGLITSNFLITESGEIKDHQCGVILVK